VIRVELGKLVRRPRTWVSIGMLCLLPIVVAIFISATGVAPPPGDGRAFLSTVLSNGSLYPAAAMAIVVPVLLPISVAVLAGDAVAGEAAAGTLRYLLIRPVSRSRLLVAKLLTVTVFVLMSAVAVLATSYVTGITLFGAGSVTQTGVTSLSGITLTPTDIVLRLLATLGYITVSMLGVAAVALFLSTVTTSPLGATLGALAVLVGSQLLITLGAAASVAPYLPTRYWLAWVDLFRVPILWRDIVRGIGIQAAYVFVFLGAAWANFLTKDVTG
jgi:ABC-2 type transport system permease protein